MTRAPTVAFQAIAGAAAIFAAVPVDAGVTVQPLATDRVASGLNRPVGLAHAPNDLDRLFILEQRGVIKILNLDDETVNATPFLNIDGLIPNISGNDERGLLGMAFHPDYENNGYFYLNYTNNSSDTVIARYQVSPTDPDSALGTGTILATYDQPFTNHNGGWIEFRPGESANYLYISTGDGGSGGDPGNRAQDITNQPLGKMLRYDVGASGTSFIPAAAPSIISQGGDSNIWAYGLRNAWRNSFDRLTGDMWIGDVGQNAWEEINRERTVTSGGINYGWRCREGNHNYNTSGNPCTGLTGPVHEYSHSVGFSLTGGYIYRGCEIPDLQGTYFFADFIIQYIASFRFTTFLSELTTRTSELSPSIDNQTVNQISSFGEDAAGEIYIVDRGGSTTGQIFRIIPETPRNPGDVNIDGITDVNDLVEVIQEWGPCNALEPCYSDLVCDGTTDVNDLVEVITGWTPSP